jgi:DNA-binding transcriptional LysR family regulator
MKLAKRIAFLQSLSTKVCAWRLSTATPVMEYHLFQYPMENHPAASHATPVEGAGGGLKDLTSLRVYVRVVDLKSFSEVARRMGITPATVSKHIASLEATLHARLVNRTTRRLFITEAGQRFYEHCVTVLNELDRAESELAEIRGEPGGHIRVTAPLMFAIAKISPNLPAFMRQSPRISLDLDFSIEKIDLLAHRIDVAVRIAEAVDPGFVAFRLAPYSRVFCASPQYLEEHGAPQTPDDLAHHNCLISRGASLNATWPVVRDGAIVQVRVSGNLIANHGAVVRDAAVGGRGISMAAKWMVEDDLAAGRLVEVLQGYAPANRAVYAVLPRQGTLLPKVRAFVDFLRECCSGMK